MTSRRSFLLGAIALGGFGERAAAQEPRAPLTQDELKQWLEDRSNWGRWGADDQKGAVNLVTEAKKRQAASLVRSGRSVSLSREFEPAQQFIRRLDGDGDGPGAVIDYLGFIYHGYTTTHIDALCHVWGDNGIWNGRDPDDVIKTDGAHFGDVSAWSDGIVTRGVLLDVPRYRGTSHVSLDAPIHGSELEAIAKAQGVVIEPGDALLVYGGRPGYEAAGGDYTEPPRPGLHASCIKTVRDWDICILGWDLMDATDDDFPLAMHSVLHAYGVGLLDNAYLEGLANACIEENRYEFMLMVLPLRVPRGTGSPVNPVAMF